MTPVRSLGVHATLDDHAALISLSGEVDIDTAPLLRSQVGTSLRTRLRSLTIDFGAVSFCDCSGLNALLWARQQAREAGIAFQVRNVEGQPARLFELVGPGGQLGQGMHSVPLAS